MSASTSEQCKTDKCRLEVDEGQSTSVVTLTRAAEVSEADRLESLIPDNPCAQGETLLSGVSSFIGRTTEEKACTIPGVRMIYHRTETEANIMNLSVPQCDPEDEELTARERLPDGRVRVRCYSKCANAGAGAPNEQEPGGIARTERESRMKCRWKYDRTGSGRRRMWFGGAGTASLDAGDRPFYNVILTPRDAPQTQTAQTYAANKKLFITPDKQFRIKYDGTEHAITKMAIYRPCPIRIENIQADAVLSLNDYSDPTATIVILIPLSAGLRVGAAGDFVGRVMQNVNGFVMNETTNQYEPITMPSGHDWQITKILESTQDPKDAKNTLAKAFYSWTPKDYEEYEVRRDSHFIYYDWRPKPGSGIRTVMLADPVLVSYTTSAYFQLLPYAPSSESAPPAPAEGVVYKPAKCTTCTNGFAVGAEDLAELQEQAAELTNPATLAFLVGMFFLLAVAFFAIYFAMDLALGGNGRFFMSGPISIAGWLAGPATQESPA